MTALLPPNLLRLFAPRPQPHFLKPLTRDDSRRGPDALVGVASLVGRLREEAEDAEVKQGMQEGEAPGTAAAPNDPESKSSSSKVPAPAADVKVEKADGADVEMENGEVPAAAPPLTNGKSKKKKGKSKATAAPPRKMDAIAKKGIVGQEARKMRLEARKKRQEEYKKTLEKNCELRYSMPIRIDLASPEVARIAPLMADKPQDDENAVGDPYKTLFISRLVRSALGIH